MNHFMLFSHS